MVQILFPSVPDPPTYDLDSGLVVSVFPWNNIHARWQDDYEYYDQLGRTPFQQYRVWLIEDPTERVEMAQKVLEKYPKQKHRRKMLFEASVRGDEAIVRCLISTGLKVHPDMQQSQPEIDESTDNASSDDIPDIDDLSIVPLHAAAYHGKLGCVKIFIKGGVEVDVRDEIGRTPLVAAASGCHLDVVRYLLEAGADASARTYADNPLAQKLMGFFAGAGALEWVASKGNVEAMKLLLKHQSQQSIRKEVIDRYEDSNARITPLAFEAAAGGGFEAFKLLLDEEAYPTENKDGKTKTELLSETQRQTLVDATATAVEVGALESLKLLLSYQYPTDNDGNILPFAVPEELHKSFIYGAYNSMNNQPEKFEFIYNLGIKEHEQMSLDTLPEGQSMNFQHLLETAVEVGSVVCVELMIEKYGAQPDKSRMPPSIQPLYLAAMHNQTDMVRYLLENHKVDIHVGNGRYAAGPTALWVAIRLKSLDSIAILLQHGGPVNHIDEDILNIKQPMTAILAADIDDKRRPVVHFKTWSTEQEESAATGGDFLDRNPPYVRVDVGPDDKSWISGLEYRKSDEELREKGEGARQLDETEAVKVEDLDKIDFRRMLAEFPTLREREKELEENDDLMPAPAGK